MKGLEVEGVALGTKRSDGKWQIGVHIVPRGEHPNEQWFVVQGVGLEVNPWNVFAAVTNALYDKYPGFVFHAIMCTSVMRHRLENGRPDPGPAPKIMNGKDMPIMIMERMDDGNEEFDSLFQFEDSDMVLKYKAAN